MMSTLASSTSLEYFSQELRTPEKSARFNTNSFASCYFPIMFLDYMLKRGNQMTGMYLFIVQTSHRSRADFKQLICYCDVFERKKVVSRIMMDCYLRQLFSTPVCHASGYMEHSYNMNLLYINFADTLAFNLHLH